MFLLLLIVVLVGAVAHLLGSGPRTRERAGRLLVLWVLVGYCGIPMIVVAVTTLARPTLVADLLGFPVGNPFQAFMGWAYLGMSIVATASLVYRDRYLLGPAVLWAVFFGGATIVHLRDAAGHGALTHGNVLFLFATHGLISVLLVAGMLAGGLLARDIDRPEDGSRKRT